MALTEEDKLELLNAIKSDSVSLDELDTVQSLTGLTSLPAMGGGKLVNAPLTLLQKPATDAAATATAAATAATNAAAAANDSATAAVNAASVASGSADKANKAADDATAAAAAATEATEAMEGRLVASVSATKDEDNDRVTLTLSNTGGEAIASVDIPVGGSSGGNTVNVTQRYPLDGGYYTLAAAIAAVEDKLRVKGACVTFESAQGEWVTKQFTGSSLDSWETEASWTDFGGGGTIKGITVNGEQRLPDASGVVGIVFDRIEVDETIDAGSTNPVQNAAIAARLGEVEALTVFGMNAEVSGDETSVRLSLTNKSGAEIAAVDIPAGSGGGGGDGTAVGTRIVLNASVDNAVIKEGGTAKLTYSYDHQYSSGDDKGVSTGQKATVTVTLLRGSTTTYSQTLREVSAGTYELDISKYIFAGTTDIYVRAVTTDPTTGKEQTKQGYTNVKAVSLSLSSAYNLSNSIAGGGYGSTDTAVIPYSVSGSGTKVVTLYVDGVQRNAATVTRSGTTNGSFNISMSGLAIGRHTVQMVAELEAAEDLTLRSESIYLDIFKAGSDKPVIGTMHTFKDGRIFTDSHLIPELVVGQYEELAFDFVVYDPKTTPASVSIYRNGILSQSVSVPRAAHVYSNRFLEQGTVNMNFKCGSRSEYPFTVTVTESGIDVSETTYGLHTKLSAMGRSNEESNPGIWESGDVTTTFDNVDWKTSGWTGDALRLMNGAKATVGSMPFLTDVSSTGFTFEAEFRLSNVMDRDVPVISCMDGNKGFRITAEEAAMYTGSAKTVTTEDGGTLETPVGVSMKFAPNMWLKVAFTVGRRADGRLMELYINGVRSKADIYGTGDFFNQDNPSSIIIDSSNADVELRNIRIYNRAITDDEELSNYIIDRQTTEEMVRLIEDNDVLDEDTGEVSIDKLLSKGKGVLLFVREGGLDEVNATNNKSQDFLCDYVFIYTPWGDIWEIRNCYIRIQGTSSTKYPRKNYRIYCAKGQNPEVYKNGVLHSGNKIPVMEGDVSVKVLCAKCDYSDSSMVGNTGWARLFNDIYQELGLLTPPQAVNDKVRSTINGYPVDVFSAETIDGERTYYGTYNLNNDKGDWADVTGMNPVKDAEGNEVAWECPMAFEFLNNSYPLGKFQLQGKTDGEVDAELDAGFDDALEFNFPKDVYWNADKAAEEEGTIATAAQKAAVKRLFKWIRDCVPAGADMTCRDLSTWSSPKFKSELSQYFDIPHLLTYLIATDYNAMVDQRVKNMIMRTWNGLLWYITYYDGDTMLGLRNDSFLKYLYTLSRETYDAEKGGYAFEGFDSWLWALVWANMETELKACADNLRRVMTNQRVLNTLNEAISGNWCERIFNKSQHLKYIVPQIHGVEVGGSMVTYPYIYALQGTREAHRTHFISNRYALLDARYETGNYTSDNIDMYMSRTADDAPVSMTVTANELYYFGYGTNNTPSIQGSRMAEAGGDVELTFSAAFSLNDPIRVYGASRMRELVTGTAGNQLVGSINLNKCSALRVLDMSTDGTGSDCYINLDNCRQLTTVNLSGQSKIRTGSQASTELDLSSQTRLQSFDGRGIGVSAVRFAEGAPLTTAALPASLTTLRLQYLPKLTMEGLRVEGYGNISTLIFSACPHLDWLTLAGRCSGLQRLRIEGVDLSGDGSLLASYMTMRGIDMDGNATDTCRLAGRYRLTRYPSEEDLSAWRAHYPELNILLPDYTMIEHDTVVADDANVSNLDNSTGYRFGNAYTPSGHLAAILRQRHRVLAKVTGMPTTRDVRLGGIDTTVNNPDGEMTYFPLDDTDSRKYADGSSANLDGSEGDWMMYEPFYWFKGVNDYLSGKNYSCYCSFGPDHRPSSSESSVMTLESIKSFSGGYRSGRKIMTGKDTLSASYSTDSSYSVCMVDVTGYRRVRFPTVPGTNLVGSVFTDADGNVVGTVIVPSINCRFEAGMYVIADIPAGASSLHFSVLNSAEFDKVVLSNSDRIEDMEPDWVASDEHLCAVVGSTVVGSSLRAVISGGSTAHSMSWSDFHYYSVARGMQQIDAVMHSRIANLFYGRYGRRDCQDQCGAGSHSSNRITGGTAGRGMADTIGYSEAVTVNPKATYSLGDGIIPQYAWYRDVDEYGDDKVTQSNNTCCLGYEDIYGHKYDMMDGVDIPNTSGNTGKWRIFMPDGSVRWVKGKTSSDVWTCAVAHGLHMDMVPVGTAVGSSSTYFHDKYYLSTAASRVVFRGGSYAYATAGLSHANAYYDSSNTNTYIGSRLAFRGKLVKSESVEAYKALTDVGLE